MNTICRCIVRWLVSDVSMRRSAFIFSVKQAQFTDRIWRRQKLHCGQRRTENVFLVNSNWWTSVVSVTHTQSRAPTERYRYFRNVIAASTIFLPYSDFFCVFRRLLLQSADLLSKSCSRINSQYTLYRTKLFTLKKHINYLLKKSCFFQCSSDITLSNHYNWYQSLSYKTNLRQLAKQSINFYFYAEYNYSIKSYVDLCR